MNNSVLSKIISKVQISKAIKSKLIISKAAVFAILIAVSMTTTSASSQDANTQDMTITRAEEEAFINGTSGTNQSFLVPTKVNISGNLIAGYNTLSTDVEVTQMNLSLEFEFGEKVKAVLDLDGRALAGKNKIKERLIQNPDLRSSVASSLRLAIASRLGVSPSVVVVPPALLNQTVVSLVDKVVTDSAVKESTIRQLFVSVEVVRTDDAATIFTVGKVDPIYYNENLYGHLATANPAIRITQEYKSWSVSVSAYSNRYGENWNIDGTSVGQIQNLIERVGHNDKLNYDINSYELLVSKLTKRFGNVIVAVGTRENGVEYSDKSTYTLVQINPQLGTFNMSLTGSLENFDKGSLEVPGGGERTRFTADISKALNEKTTAFLQAYYGNQTGAAPNRQKALILGIERIFFRKGDLDAGARVSVIAVENTTTRSPRKREYGLFTGFVIRWK